MTPLLIIALPEAQPPIVWWASDRYVVAATARLDEGPDLSFDEACRRYSELHGQAHFFEDWSAAMAWADSYLGPNYLEVRAAVARAPERPPHDLALSE